MARLEIEIGGSDRGGNAELQETLGLLEQLNQLKRGLTLDLFKAESVEQIKQVGEELTSVNIGIGKYLNLASKATQAWQDNRTATILDNLANKVAVAQANTSTFGQTIRTQTAELRAYQTAFDQLIANGVDRVSTEVMAIDTKIKTLTNSINQQKSALAQQTAYDNLQTKLKQISANMKLVGDSTGTATAQSRAYQTAINALIKAGLDPANEEVKQLQATIQQLNAQIAQSKAAELGAQFQRTGSLILDAENKVAALKRTLTFATNEESIASLNQRLAEAQKEVDRLKNVGLSAGQVMRRFGQQTNSVGVEFARVVQDLPYASRAFGAMQDNFGAIGNNITRIAELWPVYINNVRAAMIANGQATTTFAVLRASMVGMISGFNGVILAISLLTSAFTIWQTLSARRAREAEREKKKEEEFAEVIRKRVRAMDAVSQAQNKGARDALAEKMRIDTLRSAIEDESIARDRRVKMIKELRDQYPSHFKNLKDEEILAGNVAEVYEKLADNLMKAALAQAAMGKAVELGGQLLDLNTARMGGIRELNRLSEEQLAIEKEIADIRAEFGGGDGSAVSSTLSNSAAAALADAQERLTQQKLQENRLESRLLEVKRQISDINTQNSEASAQDLKVRKEIADLQDYTTGLIKDGADITKDQNKDLQKQAAIVKEIGDSITGIYNPETDRGNLVGLDGLYKTNQATQNRYQEMLDKVAKKEQELTTYFNQQLKKKTLSAEQANTRIAEVERQAAQERIEIQNGLQNEILANTQKYVTERAQVIAQAEARAGKGRVASRESELAAERAYWLGRENQLKRYGVTAEQFAEYRKTAEAAINEKWDQKMLQSSFIYQRRENDSLEQMLIRSLNKRTELELSQLRGDNQKKLALQKRYFEELRAIQARAAAIDVVSNFDGSAFTLMFEEMETKAMLLRGQVDANIISLRQYAQEMANLAAKSQVLDVIRGQFESLSQGIGDSLAEAAIEGESALEALEATFKSMAKTVISELIQIGARYLINQAIGTSSMAATVATSAAAAKTVAASWSTAAALVAAATFGASAATGAAALGALIASTRAMATGFYSGGYTGNVGRRKVAGVVHGQEFVMNAVATRENRPILEAMNSGLDYSRHLPKKPQNVNYGSIRDSQAPAPTVVVRGEIQNGVVKLSNERASRYNRKFGRE